MPTPLEEQLNGAIESLRTREHTSIRAAAKAYRVKRDTLTRRLCGGLSYTQARQQHLLLSIGQERLFIDWILSLEKLGHSPSRTQIREFVMLTCRASGGPTTIGMNWVPRYLQRHPDIKSKVGRKNKSLRIKNTSPEALENRE